MYVLGVRGLGQAPRERSGAGRGARLRPPSTGAMRAETPNNK